jgi:glycosyltransferase involved in cell wall biosynthesis
MSASQIPCDCLVVIPALNESPTIGRVVEETLSVAQHVCVIDDGSEDNTGSVARSKGATVIRHERQSGLGASLRTGFEYAERQKFQHVVTLDADGAHDPSHLPGLIDTHLKHEAALTIGSRFLQMPSAVDMPSQKVAANLLASILARWCLGVKNIDVLSGMRAMSRILFTQPYDCGDYSIAPEIVRTALRAETQVVEHPIVVRYDASELLATKNTEVLNFLSYCHRNMSPTKCGGRDNISKLMSLIKEKRSFSVRSDNTVIYGHPIEADDSIVFQLQNGWFEPQDSPYDSLIISEHSPI